MRIINQPKYSANNKELIEWIRFNWSETILGTRDKDQILYEIANELLLDNPFHNGKQIRYMLLNQRRNIWKTAQENGELKVKQNYLNSFGRFSNVVLFRWIKIAFYFDVDKSENKSKSVAKEFQTFQTQISDSLFDDIEKKKGDLSSPIFFEMLIDNFEKLPIKQQEMLIEQSRALI